MGAIQVVNQSSFQQDVLDSAIPVVVDFYADWCRPCRMLAPVLEKLAGEFAGRVRIVKVDVEQSPDLANQFQIASIPTLLTFRGGKMLARSSGFANEAALRQVLQQLSGQPMNTRERAV